MKSYDERIKELKAKIEKLEAKKKEPSREERKRIRAARKLLLKHGFYVTPEEKRHGKLGVRKSDARTIDKWRDVGHYFETSDVPMNGSQILKKFGLTVFGGSYHKRLRELAKKNGWSVTGNIGYNGKMFAPPSRKTEQKPVDTVNQEPSLIKRIFSGT